MRFLHRAENGDLTLTKDIVNEDERPRYAALSHTWLIESEEVSFSDMMGGRAPQKPEGLAKIRFCAEQAAEDGLEHICKPAAALFLIHISSKWTKVWLGLLRAPHLDDELRYVERADQVSEAVISMFQWYRRATHCYALLTDVSATKHDVTDSSSGQPWESAFRNSRWFKRGWTLQELLAPPSVEFFSADWVRLGDRQSLERHIHEITDIPLEALQGEPLARFPVAQRLSWAEHRQTKRKEDKAYSLLGIFGVFMPLIYGEGDHAFIRLREEIDKQHGTVARLDHLLTTLPTTPSAAFNSRENQHEPMCLPDTRVDLLHDITRWADGSDEKSIYWLNGIAGTGKSTVARTVAKHYHDQGRLGGSFFFSRGGGDAGHAAGLFTTLAVQLAKNIHAVQPHICNAIAEHNEIAQSAFREQWEQLIVNPLLQAESAIEHSAIVLVIDALDECDSEPDIRMLLRLLSSTERLKQTRLRVFITSRPEVPIRSGFQRIPEAERQGFVLHDIAPTLVNQDLTVFFENSLANIRDECGLPLSWPGSHIVARLVDISSGLFIWASTACRYISEGGQFARDRVRKLLSGHRTRVGPQKQLDKIYMTVLQESIRPGYEEHEKAELCIRHKKVLGAIILLMSPLSLNSLARLLDISADTISATLQHLHTIINIPTESGRPIRLHHPSFRDFLLDPDRCHDPDFWIDAKKVHKDFAKHSIRLMSTMLRPNMCDLSSPGVLNCDIEHTRVLSCIPSELQYTCLYWAEHYRQGGIHVRDADVTDKFYRKHFLHWLEALSLMRASSEMAAITRIYQSLLSHTDNSKQLPFVKDSRRLIVGLQSRIEQAPLQVYSAALVYSKHSNQLRNHFWDQMIPLIKYVRVVTADAPEPKDDYNYVNNLAFTPNGRELASGSIDEWVRVWNVPERRILTKYEGQDDKISSVAISPDGQLLASGSDDSTIRLWNMNTKKTHCVLTGHTKWVNAVAFSPDGKYLASGSMDESIRLWDVMEGKEVEMLELNLSCINALAFSADGSLLASGTVGQSIPLWDVEKHRLRMTLEGHAGPINSVEFSRGADWLVSGSDDMTIRIWDVAAGTEVRKLIGHTKKVWAVTFSHDKTYVASGSEDGVVRLWNANNGDTICKLEGHTSGINAVVYSPDGSLLASCSFNDEVRLWDAKTGETRGKLPDFDEATMSGVPMHATSGSEQEFEDIDGLRGHESAITCLRFSPDGQLVVSGSHDATLKVWTKEGAEKHKLVGHTGSISYVAFSPSGDLIASASVDTTVKLWNVVSGEGVHTLEGHSNVVRLIRFSSDGRMLASCSVDKTISLWSIESGDLTSTLRCHSDTVNDIAFAPDDSHLASCSDDKTICLWRIKSKSTVLVHTMKAHDDSVSSVAFSPDGRLLVSCSVDKTVKTWSAAGGALLQTFLGHKLPVNAAAFSRDGKRLASSSDDETIRIWPIDNEAGEDTMIMGVVVRSVSFTACGRFIETDRGWISIGSSPEKPSSISRALFVTENWVKCDQNDALWLLEDYHAASVATRDETTVLGHSSGAISFIEF
ncbi:hypothetical protein LTR97_004494 [Elasticomyces elasticus]|uniref:Mitochondrial division protein 1 n=1 Tax=Elasticomyces elasticus TaxID=574655 RepID=A0AAN7W6Q5_9PEZI|nr:hypothetical protein LTR97_004494 [Elasticomyces elasticus]